MVIFYVLDVCYNYVVLSVYVHSVAGHLGKKYVIKPQRKNNINQLINWVEKEKRENTGNPETSVSAHSVNAKPRNMLRKRRRNAPRSERPGNAPN